MTIIVDVTIAQFIRRGQYFNHVYSSSMSYVHKSISSTNTESGYLFKHNNCGVCRLLVKPGFHIPEIFCLYAERGHWQPVLRGRRHTPSNNEVTFHSRRWFKEAFPANWLMDLLYHVESCAWTSGFDKDDMTFARVCEEWLALSGPEFCWLRACQASAPVLHVRMRHQFFSTTQTIGRARYSWKCSRQNQTKVHEIHL